MLNPHPTHRRDVLGLDRLVLERAELGEVLEEVASAPAVGAAYRRLDAEGYVAAEWYAGDLLPLTVALTPAGRLLLRGPRRV